MDWLPKNYTYDWLVRMERICGKTSEQAAAHWTEAAARPVLEQRSTIEAVRHLRIHHKLGLAEGAVVYVGLMRRFGGSTNEVAVNS